MGGYKSWSNGEVLTASDVNGYIGSQVVMQFATVSARNTALASPTNGMMCYCADTGEMYVYRGSIWASAFPREVYKPSGEYVQSTTSYQNDSDLVLPAETNSKYLVEAFLITYSATGTVQINVRYALPGSAVFSYNQHGRYPDGDVLSWGYGRWSGSLDTSSPTPGMPANAYTDAAFCITMSGLLTTAGSAGNFLVQWAPTASTANNIGLAKGSWLSMRKVG